MGPGARWIVLGVCLGACRGGDAPDNDGSSSDTTSSTTSSGATLTDETGTTTSSTTGGVDETGTDTTTGAPVDPEECLDHTLREQVTAMEALALASADLTSGYLARIAAIDEGGPAINAILSMIADPPTLAVALDDHRGEGRLL